MAKPTVKAKRKRDPEMRNIEARRRKRADGSVLLTYRVRWIDDTGERQREEFDDVDEAKEFRDKLEERAEQLRKGPTSRATTTVWGAKAKWWEQHVLTRLEQRTRDNYEGAWDRHLKHRVDGLVLIDLTTSELERLKDEMLAEGVGASTVKLALAVLGSILAFGVRRNMVDFNTALAVEAPAVRKKRPRRVPPKVEVVERMRALAVSQWDSAMTAMWISLAAYAGLRPGEVRGLRWCNVWEATLVILKTPDPDGESTSDTKTHRSRSAELLKALAVDLRAWRAITPYAADSDFVIPAADGGAMSDDDYKNWVKRKFKPVARAAGWECTPYDLRHFNASLLIKEGRLSNQEIATHLGHSLNELSRTYAHELAEYRGRQVDVQAEIEQARHNLHGTEPLLRIAVDLGADIRDTPGHVSAPMATAPAPAAVPAGVLDSLVNLNVLGVLTNDELAEKVRSLVAA
ncbi:integrase [Baekduia alba]|uniref:site-specific integrase n=1 Tax=Baekduia alba TaxID=2997333 RepID=UPI0023420C92|nr:tyrosine-type recombinase/integrase [Baekduia alba]WCB96523.1 integrase [Baekduia alba]